MERSFGAGDRYLHAANREYRQKPADLDSAYTGICCHRPYRNLYFPHEDEWGCRGLRHGYLRSGVYTGWINDITAGTKAGITSMDWLGLVLVCFILPAVLTLVFAYPMRKKNLIKENDLKLDL